MTISHVTSHVLDSVTGHPAAGVPIRLEHKGVDGWSTVGAAETDADGRVGELGPERLEPGSYRVTFDTHAYYSAAGRSTFYPEVTVAFSLTEPDEHYHIPLLLSPFAYSTYRGS